jgi:hypothetical protein
MLILLALLAAAPDVTGWIGQQPQLAAADRRVFLSLVRDNTIVVLRSTDGGRQFEEQSVIRPAGTLAAGMHRGPRIAVTDRAVIVSAIVGGQGGGKDGDVVLYRSADEGRSWSEGLRINDVPGSAREGLHAMAANRSGVTALAWLDLRQPGTRVFSAVSRDGGLTWSHDLLAYESPSGSVCECCHPSVAVADDGAIAVMFRNQLEGHRDMYIVWSRDGRAFEPASKLGEGTWPLQGCPMDGGGVAISGTRAITTWRRAEDIYLAAPNRTEERIGAGRNPAVSAAGLHVDTAWTDAAGLTLRQGQRTTVLGPGRFPSVLAFEDATLLAWEDGGRVLARRIDR